MRILIWSNAPFSSSGYATVTRNLARQLKKAGHEVIIFAYYGIQPGCTIQWNDIPVVPGKHDKWGRDVVNKHMEHFDADICLQIFDLWVAKNFADKVKNLVAYSPVDHSPISPMLADCLDDAWKVVPMCEFSEKELEKADVHHQNYIPHGVNPDVFHPMDKSKCREKFDIPQDAFVIGMVAGNYDKELRKRWDKNFQAAKKFIEQHPDEEIMVFAHTDISETQRGYDLQAMADVIGISEHIKTTNPYEFTLGASPERVAEIYNTFDVYMSLASREGFGLCSLEANACKVPSLQTDYSAMHEMTQPELRVDVKNKIMMPLISWTAIPDVDDAVDKLNKLYEDKAFREEMAEKCYEFSKDFHWEDIVKEQWLPLLDDLEAELDKRSEPLEV